MIWFCEAKTFRRKIVTKTSKVWIFSLAENKETLKGSTLKVFGSVRQTILDRNSWYSLFLSIDFFATGKILKHSTEGLLYEMFQHFETTNFSRKILTTPPPSTLSSILLRYPKLMKDWRVRLQFFRHCGTKFFRGNSWYFPPPLIHKLFRNQKNSETEHRGVPLRKASVLWDEIFRMKILTLPPPSYP